MVANRLKRDLTKEQRIKVILLVGRGTTCHITCNCNAMHRMQITHDTVAKFRKKFKRTCSFVDASISWRPTMARDKDTSTQLREVRARSPTEEPRRFSAQMGISQRCAMRILWVKNWSPDVATSQATYMSLFFRHIYGNTWLTLYINISVPKNPGNL